MKKLLYMFVLLCLSSAYGCGDVQCDSDSDCAEGEVCADAGGVLFSSRVCVAATDVTNNSTPDMARDLSTPDMAVDMSVADGGSDDLGIPGDMQSDAQSTDMDQADMPCVPRSSQDICESIASVCGSPMVEECGAVITVNCGQCGGADEECESGQCVCQPESDTEFCSRLGTDCGMVTDTDNCGEARTVDCGTCMGNEQCGEQAPNVCGCPCQIGGVCYPDGAPNAANPCEVCDPSQSTTSWSVDTGKSCSDGDLCTQNDVCQSNGTCVGDAVVCNSSSACRTSSCNPSTGACNDTNVPDGMACPGSGGSCVSHACQSGVCQSSIISGTCLIGGTCYLNGDDRPGNTCEECRPGFSQTSWSDANAGKTCASDGLSCTVDACDGNGMCDNTLAANRCLIGGTCYNDEERNPSQVCEWCDPSVSTSAWSIAANQQCNSDGVSCTLDICNSTGQCTHPVLDGRCRIGGTCYVDDDRNPSAECEWCDSTVSKSAWVDAAAGTSCSDDGVTCTDDVCDGNGACDHPIASNKCYIGMTCYNAGETQSFNCCRGCNPSQSQTTFTGINDGLTCSFMCGAGGGSCQNGACTDGMNLCIPTDCPL